MSGERLDVATKAFCAVQPSIKPAGWEFRMKVALRAADEAEASDAENLAAALRVLIGSFDEPGLGMTVVSAHCVGVGYVENARAVLAAFDARRADQ